MCQWIGHCRLQVPNADITALVRMDSTFLAVWNPFPVAGIRDGRLGETKTEHSQKSPSKRGSVRSCGPQIQVTVRNPLPTMMKALLALAALLMATPSLLHAQGLVVPFIGPVNRSMGSAAVAAPLDAMGAVYWNPATMSALPSSELSFGMCLSLADIETASVIPANPYGIPTGPVQRRPSPVSLRFPTSVGYTILRTHASAMVWGLLRSPDSKPTFRSIHRIQFSRHLLLARESIPRPNFWKCFRLCRMRLRIGCRLASDRQSRWGKLMLIHLFLLRPMPLVPN